MLSNPIPEALGAQEGVRLLKFPARAGPPSVTLAR